MKFMAAMRSRRGREAPECQIPFSNFPRAFISIVMQIELAETGSQWGAAALWDYLCDVEERGEEEEDHSLVTKC